MVPAERKTSHSCSREDIKANGKTVVIEKNEFPMSPEFISDVDESFFKLSDITGFSPDERLTSDQSLSDQGHEVPCVLCPC